MSSLWVLFSVLIAFPLTASANDTKWSVRNSKDIEAAVESYMRGEEPPGTDEYKSAALQIWSELGDADLIENDPLLTAHLIRASATLTAFSLRELAMYALNNDRYWLSDDIEDSNPLQTNLQFLYRRQPLSGVPNGIAGLVQVDKIAKHPGVRQELRYAYKKVLRTLKDIALEQHEFAQLTGKSTEHIRNAINLIYELRSIENNENVLTLLEILNETPGRSEPAEKVLGLPRQDIVKREAAAALQRLAYNVNFIEAGQVCGQYLLNRTADRKMSRTGH